VHPHFDRINGLTRNRLSRRRRYEGRRHRKLRLRKVLSTAMMAIPATAVLARGPASATFVAFRATGTSLRQMRPDSV